MVSNPLDADAYPTGGAVNHDFDIGRRLYDGRRFDGIALDVLAAQNGVDETEAQRLLDAYVSSTKSEALTVGKKRRGKKMSVTRPDDDMVGIVQSTPSGLTLTKDYWARWRGTTRDPHDPPR